MDDARNLQYGIGFDTADAETSVENLGEKVETLEENIGAVEVGAQQMGASAVSACQMGQGAAERFTGAVGDASGGLDDMASSASKAGNAAQKAAGHWNMTAEGLEWVEEAAQAAEAAAESFRDEMDDSGGAAGRFRAQIKKTAESARFLVKSIAPVTPVRKDFEMRKTSARHSSTPLKSSAVGWCPHFAGQRNLRMKPQTARTMPEIILRKWVPPGKMPATKSKKLYPGRSRLLLALKP